MEVRLDPAALDTVLAAVLIQHPDAHVAAIASTGLFVEMPAGVPLAGQQLISGPSSALDLVIAEDRVVVFHTWGRALKTGVANALVRPMADPQQFVRIHFIDATHTHGIMLGFMIGFHRSGAGAGLIEAAVPPRLSVMRKDQIAIMIEVDAAATLMLGWSAEELLGQRTLDFIHPDDHLRSIASWMDMLASPGVPRRVRFRHEHRDGRWLWMEVTNINRLGEPDYACVTAELVDISDEMTAQEALRASEQLLRRLTEALPLGVLQIDTNLRVIYQNDRVDGILPTSAGLIITADTLAAVVPADRDAVAAAMTAVVREGLDSDLECGYQHGHGLLRRCSISLRALSTDSGEITGAIICVADVTEDARLREELKYRATFDPLTGCHNRATLLAALEHLLASPARDNVGTAVIFIDLNEFKEINDRFGHAAGDRLLEHVAILLRRASRDGDLVGRFGGDEFVVLAGGVEDAAEARRIAERLVAELDASDIDLAGQLVQPQASIGVAWSGPGPGMADALIARADTAMYEAKKHRTGRLALAVSA
jgi:diguanylate cyclase (GGDEF)-like protein/PAS domain S-box-containing protein